MSKSWLCNIEEGTPETFHLLAIGLLVGGLTDILLNDWFNLNLDFLIILLITSILAGFLSIFTIRRCKNKGSNLTKFGLALLGNIITLAIFFYLVPDLIA
jgi:hypothetical protein